MKNIIATTITLLALGMLLAINAAFAGNRVKVYEMAESGIAIEFEMTHAQTADADARNAGLTEFRETNNNEPQKRVKVIKMGESGQSVFFPMTAGEIADEAAKNERRTAIRKVKSKDHRKQVVIYDLSESGISVEFPVETPNNAGDEAITENLFSDDLKI